MALEKSLETPYGVDAGYWRILQVHLDFVGLTARLIVGGYLNAETRQSGASPLAIKEYTTIFESSQTELTREDLYGFLLSVPEFEGAGFI